MMVQECTCGSTSFFLREKDSSKIGLYCARCEKWSRWVNKKDIMAFRKLGYEVHKSDYMPQSIGMYDSTVNALNGAPQQGVPVTPVTPVTPVHPSTQALPQYQTGHASMPSPPAKAPCDLCVAQDKVIPNTNGIFGDMDGSTIRLRDSSLIIEDQEGYEMVVYDVNFCPRCGRDLKAPKPLTHNNF